MAEAKAHAFLLIELSLPGSESFLYNFTQCNKFLDMQYKCSMNISSRIKAVKV